MICRYCANNAAMAGSVSGVPNVLSLSCEPASHGDRQSGAPLAPTCRMTVQAARRRPEPRDEAPQRRAIHTPARQLLRIVSRPAYVAHRESLASAALQFLA